MKLRDLPSVDELARGIDDPLAVDAARVVLARVREDGGGYSNLEYELEAGTRGSRQDHAAAILRRLTGAEAALVVNNNAAAVMLALAALAEGREVLVSRGELIEIGDGFRIPDVLARSGALLREVGTTNRTRAADYERAVGPETALLQRVQRADKLTLAALEGTLGLYLDPERAAREVPVLRMLQEPPEAVCARAGRLAAAVGGTVEETVGRVGGGALPLAELPSFACTNEEGLSAPPREAHPP